MSDDLKKRLRDTNHIAQGNGFDALYQTCGEAADCIETLTAENIVLQAEVQTMKTLGGQTWTEIESPVINGLRAEVARLTPYAENLEHWRQEVGKLHSKVARLTADKRLILDERDRTFALMLARAEAAEARLEAEMRRGVVADLALEEAEAKLAQLEIAHALADIHNEERRLGLE